MERLTFIALLVGTIYIVAKLTFNHLRDLKYKKLTGRPSYLKDHGKYKREFWELVKYFENNQKLKLQHLPKLKWTEADGIILGKAEDGGLCYIPAEELDNGKGILVFGTPGSGKTATVAKCTLKQLSQEHTSICCINIKGDMETGGITAHRTIKHFNPGTPGKSCHFNPFAGIKNMDYDELDIFINKLSQILVRQEAGDNDRFFTPGARNYFCGILHALIHDNPDVSFADFVKAILEGNSIDWVKQAMQSESQGMRTYLCSFYQQNEKNIAGCYGALCSAIRPFARDSLRELFKDDEDCISYHDLEEGTDIFIDLTLRDKTTFAPIVVMILEILFSDLMSHRESDFNESTDSRHNILFMLDEFGVLPRIPSLNTVLADGRSFGISVLMLMQAKSQVEINYGKEGAEEIINCCSQFAFANITDVATRQWACQLIGKEKALHISNSLQTGNQNQTRSTNETMDNIFEENFFSTLADTKKMLIYQNGKYLLADKIFYFKED